jgi:hypothetical protein
MPHRYKCSTCDKWHEGFPDVGYDRPRYAADVPKNERAARVFLTSDLCIVDGEHYFIRCVLPLPIRGTGDDFCWGVWSTLSKANFLRYRAAYDDDMSDWEPMFGYLSNNLPGYPETLSLKLSVQPQSKGNRPVAMLEPTDHPLAIEQRDGMAIERAIEISAPFIEH